jgi:hypothetical protein
MASKPRTGIPDGGPKLSGVMNMDAHGVAMADKRYGRLPQVDMKPKDQSFPQFKEDQPLDKTYNDHPKDWVRGFGDGKPKR